MSLTKLSLVGNYQIIPGQGEFDWLTSRLGTGKTVNFCYSVADYSVIGAIVIFMRVHGRGVI
jgi:hypothetical protein